MQEREWGVEREVTSSIQQHSAVLRSNNLSYSQAPTDQTLASQDPPKRQQIQNVTLLQKALVKDKYTRPLSVPFLILTEKQVQLKDTRRVKDKYTA